MIRKASDKQSTVIVVLLAIILIVLVFATFRLTSSQSLNTNPKATELGSGYNRTTGLKSCVEKITYGLTLAVRGRPTPRPGTYCSAVINCKTPAISQNLGKRNFQDFTEFKCELQKGSKTRVNCSVSGASSCTYESSWEWIANYVCGNSCVGPISPTGRGIKLPPGAQPQ